MQFQKQIITDYFIRLGTKLLLERYKKLKNRYINELLLFLTFGLIHNGLLMTHNIVKLYLHIPNYDRSNTFTLSLRLSLFCEQECTKITLLCNVQIWNFQTINMKFNNNIKLK